ncbi:nucleotidyltransferase family protein [Desulfotruncus alcoholivorax]|uniref:nucleotidyltransferase family protein n=1 Tax=Desulfotruncus alcoholivorax TaxID=265477 RepID=UPI0003F5C011|nr:nucleotidyltransferase domain-containing protein [Desulfotruncus alcoholivorax]
MLTPKQLTGYRAGWLERKKKKEQELELRYQKATALAHKAAEHLKQKYHCQVFLFGSLLSKESFMEHSDIDIAIANLDSDKNFWQVYSEVMGILHPFDFDLIELERIDWEVRNYILQKGLEL